MSQLYFLVPIEVDALVVDQSVIRRSWTKQRNGTLHPNDGASWSPQGGDMTGVGHLKSPGPDPFFGAQPRHDSQRLFLPGNGDKPPYAQTTDAGVYLRWKLPAGLRHDHGEDFQGMLPIPDRWLVVRFQRASGKPGATKAWVVDSGAENKGGKANVITEKLDQKRVGQAPSLEEFQEAAAYDGLTELGTAHTGSPTFTAHVADNLGVLSFHDDLKGLGLNQTGDAPASLSYLVVGWTRQPDQDPLKTVRRYLDRESAGNAEAVLAALRFESASAAADLLDRRCLFHGMVAAVNYWDEKRYLGPLLGYPGSPRRHAALGKSPDSMVVGLGNTTAEAIATLVTADSVSHTGQVPLWQALEAACQGRVSTLLHDWHEPPHEQEIHQHWFQSQAGGSRWRVVPAERPAGTLKRPQPDPAGVPPDVVQALDDLNQKQAELDESARRLAADQQQLYALWWLRARIARDDPLDPDPALPKKEQVEAAGATLLQRAGQLRQAVATKTNARDTRHEALTGKLGNGLRLDFQPASNHWAPVNPVIAVRGAGWRAGPSLPDPLPWRRGEQAPAAVTLKFKEKQLKPPVAAVDASGILNTLTDKLPAVADGLKSLVEEAVAAERAVTGLVELTLPASLKQSGGKTEVFDNWIEGLHGALENPEADTSIAFAGASPGARIVRAWGRQPWSPLFLDWQVTWYPVASGGDFGTGWTFAGHDYMPTDQLTAAEPYVLRGRSVLAPVPAAWIRATLERFEHLLTKSEESPPAEPRTIEEQLLAFFHDDARAWLAELEKLEQQGIFVQVLNGLHEAMLSRRMALPRPDPALRDTDPQWNKDGGKLKDKTVSGALEPPAPIPGKKGGPAGVPLKTPALAPPQRGKLPFALLRSGSMTVDQLWVVDDFGQWADLLFGSPAQGSLGLYVHPALKPPETNASLAGHAVLPPRFLQPARLRVALLSAADPTRETTLHPDNSPLCGWVVYNHVDQGLLLYDGDGLLLGELELVEGAGGELSVAWECLADPLPKDGTVAGIGNATLRAFAGSLLATAAAVDQPLADLLDVIDQALPLVRPGGPRAGADSALLAGRPLALVNARLDLRLFGSEAWTDPLEPLPKTANTGCGDPRLDKLALPVRLGCAAHAEDGLVGYYTWQGGKPSFARLIPFEDFSPRDGGAYVGSQEQDGVKVSFTAPANVTLLFDPRGVVQAASGVVPPAFARVAREHVEHALRHMELSLRVEPVLERGDRRAMPAPAARPGQWYFRGPNDVTASQPVSGFDDRPRYDGQLPAALGGHLILRQDKVKE